MTIALLSHADQRIRDAVMQQLAWDSQFDASGIGVTARNGAVTMTGFIDSYAGKLAAERAAKRVRGVRAVANDIQVKLRLERTDADIAADAAQALLMRTTLPESVQVVVHSGHLTLTGRVSTLFQRAAAETAVRSIRGGCAGRGRHRPGAPVVRTCHRATRAVWRHPDVHDGGRGCRVGRMAGDDDAPAVAVVVLAALGALIVAGYVAASRHDVDATTEIAALAQRPCVTAEPRFANRNASLMVRRRLHGQPERNLSRYRARR
jgi:hypothetical protein